jgi:hypothetical protein
LLSFPQIDANAVPAMIRLIRKAMGSETSRRMLPPPDFGISRLGRAAIGFYERGYSHTRGDDAADVTATSCAWRIVGSKARAPR